MEQTSPAPAPAAPAPSVRGGQSFREQALARLQAEGGAPARPAAPGPSPAPQPREPAPARQREPEPRQQQRENSPADDEAPPATTEESEQQEGEREEHDDAGQQESVEYSDDVPTLHAQLAERDQEIERLSKRESELTSDYSRKTAMLGEWRRSIETNIETVRSAARRTLAVIDAPVRRFEGIDWAALQTNDPVKYQQVRQQYQAVVQARNGYLESVAREEQEQEQILEQQRGHHRAMALDILRVQIPNYSDEHYKELRALAGDVAGYSPEEFDRNDDHKLVLIMNRLHSLLRARGTVKVVKREQQKQPPSTAQQQGRPAFRNEAGQFQNAKQNLAANRGNKQAGMNFFAAKLAAERKSRGGW